MTEKLSGEQSRLVRMVSIDPGLHHCGVAMWAYHCEEGEPPVVRLLYAYLMENTVNAKAPQVLALGMAKAFACFGERRLSRPDEVIIEWPRVYGGGAGKKGDPNDIVALGACALAIAARFEDANLTFYEPSQWKGQVPKSLMSKRILDRLTVSEQAVIVSAGSRTHNIIDAVGIGLKFLGRLK